MIAANSALQAGDFYTLLVTTCQTKADARFRSPTLTPGTYLLKMCGNRHLLAIFKRSLKTFSFEQIYAFSALETILCLMGYISVLSNSNSN